MIVKAEIKLDTSDLNMMYLAISPENKTISTGEIKTYIDNNQVITTIEGDFNIGTVINTIDDILKTAILAENVSKITES